MLRRFLAIAAGAALYAWLALVPLMLVVCGRAAGAVAGYFQAGILIGALAMSAAYAVAVSSAFILFALGAGALAGRGGAFAIAALWTACELVLVALGNAAIAEAGWRWRTGTPALRATSALVAAVWLAGALVLPATDAAGVAVAGVAPRYDLTPYVRFGDVFAIGCTLAFLLALARDLVPVPRRRRLALPIPVEG